MNKSTHFTGQLVYSQVIKMLDKSKIKEISRQTSKSESYVKRLDGYTYLGVMLFGVLKHFDSLRELGIGMKAEVTKLNHLGIDYACKRSTLAEANKRRPQEFFANVYADLLGAILPTVLIDNFNIVNFEKSDTHFEIWLDEKKVQLREDKYNNKVVAYGFGSYHSIQDFPIRGRATYLHVRKRKWLNQDSGDIFSYDWDLLEHDRTRLNAEFVVFF